MKLYIPPFDFASNNMHSNIKFYVFRDFLNFNLNTLLHVHKQVFLQIEFHFKNQLKRKRKAIDYETLSENTRVMFF